MKNELINIKNILRIFISVMVIISMVKSCAKAYTFDEFLEFANIVKDLPQADSSQKTAANWLINNESTIRTRLTAFTSSYNTTFNSWIIGRNTNNGECGIIGYQNGEFNRWDSNAASIIKNATSEAGVQQTGGQYWNYGYGANKPLAFCLLKEEIAENVDFTGKIGNNFYNSYTTLEFDNSLENTAYNGNLFTYYYKGDFYSNKQLKLGDIIPNDSYYFEIRLKDSNTEIIKGTSFVALNTTPYTFYNDSAIYINEDFELFAIPRLLNYSTQYQLEITSYYGDGNTNLEEDIDWFIFLPQNATISGDFIASLGSGDFTTQDNANQIIDNNQDNTDNIIASVTDATEVDNIMGEYTSGDIESISSDLGFSPLENPFTSFLFFVIEGVYDVMTEREDITLNTHYKSVYFNLASTDFITPQSELKTFIRNMLICVYIYGNYKYFHYMITLLETARINKFMAEIGTDEFYDTDIM